MLVVTFSVGTVSVPLKFSVAKFAVVATTLVKLALLALMLPVTFTC